jgi:hypothetical protein
MIERASREEFQRDFEAIKARLRGGARRRERPRTREDKGSEQNHSKLGQVRWTTHKQSAGRANRKPPGEGNSERSARTGRGESGIEDESEEEQTEDDEGAAAQAREELDFGPLRLAPRSRDASENG